MTFQATNTGEKSAAGNQPKAREVTRAGIQSHVDVLKSSVAIQESTADHVAKRFLNPLGQRLSKAQQGKVTLAEMARHFRLDRVLEALEGALWVEKQVIHEETAKKINLDPDLHDKLRESVGHIKVVRNPTT